jgi:hypothetical protein
MEFLNNNFVPIVFGIILLVAILMMRWIASRQVKISSRDKRYLKGQWNKLMKGVDGDPRHAIMKADIILGKGMNAAGYRGSIGEMLREAGHVFSDLDGIWGAHKKRNQIAHELSAEVSVREVKGLLRVFKRGLNDLGIKV